MGIIFLLINHFVQFILQLLLQLLLHFLLQCVLQVLLQFLLQVLRIECSSPSLPYLSSQKHVEAVAPPPPNKVIGPTFLIIENQKCRGSSTPNILQFVRTQFSYFFFASRFTPHICFLFTPLKTNHTIYSHLTHDLQGGFSCTSPEKPSSVTNLVRSQTLSEGPSSRHVSTSALTPSASLHLLRYQLALG